MTTGCTCQMPGSPGVTYRPGHRCARCHIDATPSALNRAVLRLLWSNRPFPHVQADLFAEEAGKCCQPPHHDRETTRPPAPT
jgi:hypothetical protein